MTVEKIPDIRPESPETPVTVKVCGNVIEVRYMRYTPAVPIRKIDQEHGLDLRTGEVIEYEHKENRAESIASVAQSLKRLRDLINANVTNPKTVLWITLTYAENMTDTVKLYEDYRRFWQRFRYYLDKKKYPAAEYITAAEPQARGAWHLHCLFLFPCKAPFIPNEDIARIWGHGFTKTKSLKGIDNPGLYLTAYLGDMELTEAVQSGIRKGDIAEKISTDEQGKRQTKAIIKGARLRLYPTGFNMYRNSRGVKRPEIYAATEAEAQELIGTAPLIYEKTIAITNEENEVKNIINYRQYNKAGKGEICKKNAAE